MNKLHSIELDTVLVPGTRGHNSFLGVRILVDGNDFLETVHGFERQQRIKESTCTDQMRSWPRADSKYTIEAFSGASYYENGKSLLLTCKCGFEGCWDLEAKVILTDELVVWKDFENSHRENWPYHELGVFHFSRKQYEEQLEKIPDSN